MLTTQHKVRATIISPDLIREYNETEERIIIAHGKKQESASEYWWGLWQMESRNLWRAKYEEKNKADWVHDISVETWGPSKTDFYDTMGAIERMFKMGLSEREVKLNLGKLTTAIKSDLKELFSGKKGNQTLLPEVAAQIEDGHETPAEYINRVSNLAPDEQRKEVRRLIDKDFIYPGEWEYNEALGKLLVNFFWETQEDGLVWKGTVSISATELTDPKRYANKQGYLPDKVAQRIAKKLGLSNNE